MNLRIICKRKLKRLFENKLNKNTMTWCLIVVLTFVAIAIYNFMLIPQIELKGNKTIKLNYKEKYKEKGYNANFLGKDITKDVKIKGKVNTKKIGTYEITYEVKIGTFTKKVTRKIIIQDKKKPKLEIDNKDIYLCPGDQAVAEKVKAIDEYDGDLTDKVKVNITKDKIIYSVTDKSHNKTEVIKKIYYKDIEKPEIVLKGSNYITIYIGDNFKDPGYEVKDNCDKQINAKVKVTGNVDTSKVGEYTLTYTVTDDATNDFKIERKVKVLERNKNSVIYLTFDDGPNQGTTDVILNILKEEGIKATFFVTNRGPDNLIKRAYDEGHTIALHTASHNYSIIYSSKESYFEDLNIVEERVKRITGQSSKIIRFPGGSSNTVSRKYKEHIMTDLTNEVLNRGYKYYDWNISSGDAESGTHSPEEIRDNVIRQLKQNRQNMILLHDIKSYTRDALRQIIQHGKENGFVFDKITMDTEMVRQRVNN